ncbi:prepilin peptidase [Magnetococcales bacterium HHB-1]
MLPSENYHITHVAKAPPLYKGLDALLYRAVGAYHRRFDFGRTLQTESELIHKDAERLKSCSDLELREKLRQSKTLFRKERAPSWSDIKVAMTLLVEQSERTLNLRPFPVQIMGALVIFRGALAEMATGEGKTLSATLAAILNGWIGHPCHVITVNDYLASRDHEEMGPLYHACNLSVGYVISTMSPEARRDNYAKDIVYTTSKEITADFLRDRLYLGKMHDPSRRLLKSVLAQQKQAIHDGLLMRGIHTAIVDEADSVLIDEAVTPLIISKRRENASLIEACRVAKDIADHLICDSDYKINQKYRELNLTPEGHKKIDQLAEKFTGIWRGAVRRVELIEQALMAREFYLLNKQYIIQDNRVVIVDEFTGRLMPNRTWRQGLHQAVEAKEGLKITSPSETLSRLSFQKFFRLFHKLSGMTGTAKEARWELWHIYGLNVQLIPTNRPSQRQEMAEMIYTTSEQKWDAVIEAIVECHASDRPCLIGTRSVNDSEALASRLMMRGLQFRLLNATQHEEEAEIVSQAGLKGKITIATNMAGRGTDIKLGSGVAELGGLHVIAAERNESLRIDRQLFGRCARQGDPGSVQAFMSLDDEMVRRFIPEKMRKNMVAYLNSKKPGANNFACKIVAYTQSLTQKQAFKQRREVLKVDDFMEDALSFAGTSLNI